MRFAPVPLFSAAVVVCFVGFAQLAVAAETSAGITIGSLPNAETQQIENYLYDAGFRRMDVLDLDRVDKQVLRASPYAIHVTKCCANENVALSFSRAIPDLRAFDSVYMYFDAASNFFLVGDDDALIRAKKTAWNNGASRSIRHVLSDID